jgi:hypothetical protein
VIKNHESEAGQPLAVFLIVILLISLTNLSMLFQTRSMVSSITEGEKTLFSGHIFMLSFMHTCPVESRSHYCQPFPPFLLLVFSLKSLPPQSLLLSLYAGILVRHYSSFIYCALSLARFWDLRLRSERIERKSDFVGLISSCKEVL